MLLIDLVFVLMYKFRGSPLFTFWSVLPITVFSVYSTFIRYFLIVILINERSQDMQIIPRCFTTIVTALFPFFSRCRPIDVSIFNSSLNESQ